MLSRWRKEYRKGVIVADKRTKAVTLHDDKSELNKVKKLEKENARLRLENDLLKKWQRFLAEQHNIWGQSKNSSQTLTTIGN